MLRNIILQRSSRGSDNPCDSLKFEVEERIECTKSHKVKYTHREDNILALPIPVEAATNKGLWMLLDKEGIQRLPFNVKQISRCPFIYSCSSGHKYQVVAI